MTNETTEPAEIRTEPHHRALEEVLEDVIAARRAGTDPKELFGGPRDWIDSAVPPIAFVVGNAVGGLREAVWAAAVAVVVVVLVRLVRRETLRHAFSGVFGVGIAIGIAKATGQAKNFFLPGIIINAAYALAFVVSVVVGHPLVGAIMRLVLERPKAWHEHPRVKRAYAEATLGWAGISILRVVVQEGLRRADQVGWLAGTKIAMGWPLYLAALAVTKPYIDRRTRDVPVPEGSDDAAEPEAEGGGEDAAADAP
ncbi:MAG: hypothetical protein QOE45_3151 [Frankiaceae bacterium]|nr:hypothetical protein [Frankiaceae bacterium]